MKRLFLLSLLLLGIADLRAQVTYEDFEGGTPDLNWIGLNGSFNGAVANPDQSGANTSAWVGSYTNAPAFDFCFALYTFPATLDISEYNQFKMKIWSPTAPSKALLKLEGPGGPAVEKFVDITVANEWVEYTFDLSAGASYTNLKTILVSFNSFVLGDDKTYYFDDIRAEKAQICYADFEGPGLNFLGLDGVLTSPEPNPGANQINSSPNCAKYVKSDQHAYSLILADNGTPFDLSVYNQFKIDVYATAPTQILFKLEGSGGGFEHVKNIAVTNAWQTYTFDFSAQAANTGLSKIVLFFDPGVQSSSDTYYFDNVCAVPNACGGATVNLDLIDDFECNRRATYALGWDSLQVVKNPVPTGDNNSPKVGRWNDPAGPGTEWAALVMDYQTPIDLSTKNQFSLQVWSPKTGKLLIKLEGGPNSPKEVFVDMTETNKWVTYTADFSDQLGKGHRKWVLFFNAGVNGEAGDVYYFDNVKLSAPTAAPPLEDFEGGIHLGWQALDQNEPIHGIFEGPVPNPSPNGVNTSAEVGCYTKGVSAFSTVQGISLTDFDLSQYPQFNLDVLSPAGVTGTVTLQLNSPTQGNKSVDATVSTAGVWETLSYDFTPFNNITDFSEVRIIFRPGTVAPGQKWYFDNLRQTEVTIDPCAGTLPIPTIVDDYECQRNFVQIFYGAADLKVINNPHLTPENGSLRVGEYKDPAGAGTEFAGIGYEFATPPDLSVYNHLSMQVWAPFDNVPFLFKLEGSGPGIEVLDTIKTGNKWHKFDIDFSNAVGTQHTKLVIFANVLSPTGGGTYFYDNIRWVRAGYNGCIIDHQTPNTTLGFKYFANGSLEAQGYQFEVVTNPNPTGINQSSKVGKFVKAGDALPFAGIYSNPNLESPIDWKGVKMVKAKVHMDHIGNFAVKVEGSSTGAPAFEIPVPNTKVNEWEELTFNFAAVPDNGEYRRLTLFFDLGIDATGTDVTSYFDDIVIGDGNCQSVGVFAPVNPAAMRVAPNPTSSVLLVENMEGVVRLEIFDLYGRRVATAATSGDTFTYLDVSKFPAGMYLLQGYDHSNALVSQAKFVKN